MRIGLVNVNVRSDGPEKLVGYLPPLPLLCIGGALIDAGFTDISLIDATTDNFSAEETCEVILQNNFEIVFLSAMASTASAFSVKKISKLLKERKFDIKIVVGGVHATFCFEEFMEEGNIDYLCRGEGEQFSIELMQALENNNNLHGIKGLVWNDNGNMIVNKSRKQLIDLNNFRVGWELIDQWDKYKIPMTGEKAAVIQFSRGCPNRCNFCGQWEFWKKWRYKDIVSFVNEMEFLRHNHDISYFFFADENPQTVQMVWVELFKEILKRNLGIHMILNLRVTDVIRDRRYFELFRDAGLVTVDLGVESAIQDRLDLMNKSTTIEQNSSAIEILRDNGVISIIQTLVGYPDESVESLELTFERLKKWDPDLLHFYYVTPFPWTKYGKSLNSAIIKEKNYSKWDYRHQILKLNNIEEEELYKKIHTFTFNYNFNSNNFTKILLKKNKYIRDTLINALFIVMKNRSEKIAR